MPTDIAAEIDRLCEQIRYHDRKYYVEAAQDITDLEYDRLIDRLKQLEAEHPELVAPDSPTQRVGDRPVEGLRQVEHRVPMLSIDNTYSIEELRKYVERTDKLLTGEAIEWVVELKIDGVAVSLVYEDGQLVRGVTRGNGRVGDDITHNMRTVADVPLRLSGERVPPVLEVRGEIYMANSDLVKLNETQRAKGEPPYANTRNVTAGSVRLLDPRICAARRLRLFCHGVGYVEGLRAESHTEFLDELRGYGLPATPMVECFGSFAAAVEHCEQLIERLHELDFEIDGLVLKVNRFDQRDRLGATSKSPRWVIAYKFEKYEAITRLEKITVQVGKTGTITPVANLTPVELAGTTVSRASLHNADEIARKDVREGDVVVVEKAGKIIPHIVRVEKHERTGSPRKFAFPTQCPQCDTWLIMDEGQHFLGPDELSERIEHYLKPLPAKHPQNIRGLGPTLIRRLVALNLLRGYSDLYRLKRQDLMQVSYQLKKQGLKRVERKDPQGAQQILEQLEASKEWGLERVLVGLAIQYVGPWTASRLAQQFLSIERLRAANISELSSVEGIAPIVAESVSRFLQSSLGRGAVDELNAVGVNMRTKGALETEGIIRLCPNPHCPAKLREQLKFFVHRSAMDIEGLGEKVIDQFLQEGLIRSYGDIYRLQCADVEQLKRQGEKSADNLIRAIEASKGRGLARLLNGLGIRHIGTRVAAVLAEHFGSMDALLKASVAELSKGIQTLTRQPKAGESAKKPEERKAEVGVVARNLYNYLHSELGLEIIRDLRCEGVKMGAIPLTRPGPRTLDGKTLVVTGTLTKYTRDEINELIIRHGGRAASSVSKNTDYLVAGEKAGSKLAKAKQFGVTVLNEEEFEALIQG